MLSLLVLASVLLGIGVAIAYLSQNLILVLILIGIFILLIIISKKSFLIGLVLFFVFSIANGISTYRVILDTKNYKPRNEDIVVEGVVKDFFDISGESYVYFIESDKIDGNEKKLILKIYSKDKPPPKNSQIRIKGKILISEQKLISYQNTLSLFPRTIEITRIAKFYEILSNQRLKIIKNVRSTLKSEEGNLLLSSLIGINTLEDDTKTNFQLSGTAHIFAISGLHIGIVFLFFTFLLKTTGSFAYCFALIFTFLCLIFIGLKFSAIRAFIMLGVLILGNQLGRGRNLLNSLLIAASLILLLFPDALISLSFYLSCFAILGIVVASKFKLKNTLLNMLNVSFFVNFYEAPLMIYFFKNISIISLLLNVIVIPYMSVLLPIGLIYIIISLISVHVASHLGILINALYGCLIFMVNIASKISFSHLPGSLSLLQFIVVEVLIFIATLYLLSKKNTSLKPAIIFSIVILVFSFLFYNNLSSGITVDAFEDSKVIIIKSAGKSSVIIQDTEKSSNKYLYSILNDNGVNKVYALILLKDPTIKEGLQINELIKKGINISKVYASPLVSADYLEANFPNYIKLPKDFVLTYGAVKIEYYDSTNLRVFLQNKPMLP